MAQKKIKPVATRPPRFPQHVDLQQLAAKVQSGLPLTIPEWCRKRGISRATYDLWRKAGLGPDVTQAVPNGRVTISAAADARWEATHARTQEGREHLRLKIASQATA
jgi:hypothetical protein